MLRRLVFLDSPSVVQSEVRLLGGFSGLPANTSLSVKTISDSVYSVERVNIVPCL